MEIERMVNRKKSCSLGSSRSIRVNFSHIPWFFYQLKITYNIGIFHRFSLLTEGEIELRSRRSDGKAIVWKTCHRS